jgi:hypothetical protein
LKVLNFNADDLSVESKLHLRLIANLDKKSKLQDRIYIARIKSNNPIPLDSPLHISNFMHEGNTKGKWSKKLTRDQELLMGMFLQYSRIYLNTANNMATFDFSMLSITELSRDIRQVFEKLFDVYQDGYRYDNNNFDLSKVGIKDIDPAYIVELNKMIGNFTFQPEEKPLLQEGQAFTTAKISIENKDKILTWCESHGRFDLIPMVKWMINEKEIEILHETKGETKAREYSVWPIPNMCNWPSELRKLLFSTYIDIKSSYPQFLLSQVNFVRSDDFKNRYKPKKKFSKEPPVEYTHLYRMVHDSKAFRKEIADKLHIEDDEKAIKIAKTIITAITNGSNTSATLLMMGSKLNHYKPLKDLIRHFNTISRIVAVECNLNRNQMGELGEILRPIILEIRQARKEIAFYIYGNHKRATLKQIFKDYFLWESWVRKEICNLVNNTGLMMHDGIDGFTSNYSAQEIEEYFLKKFGILITACNPQVKDKCLDPDIPIIKKEIHVHPTPYLYPYN